ncbi:hypothetical protein [Scytonema sp. HK-05]|uniref:hypothetical protein n=1 Tax=Scytonema sp. HK-05 TaxID=1137095 RepID=UPI001161024E
MNESFTLVSEYHNLLSESFTLVNEYHNLLSESFTLVNEYHNLVSESFTLVSEYHNLVNESFILVNEYHNLVNESFILVGVAEFRDDSCGVGILPAQKIQGTGFLAHPTKTQNSSCKYATPYLWLSLQAFGFADFPVYLLYEQKIFFCSSCPLSRCNNSPNEHQSILR